MGVRSVLFGLLFLFAHTGISYAQSAQPGPDLVAAQNLIAEGKSEAAFELLAPFEDDFAGDLQFDYLFARAALESGQPSVASFIYERILAVEPSYIEVRLENGRAYFDMQNYARAKAEFELVLESEGLSQDLRALAEEYAAAAQEGLTPQRTFVSGFADYGVGLDDNVTAGPNSSVLLFPGGGTFDLGPGFVKNEDFYQAMRVGGDVQHSLTDAWQVIGSVEYSNRLHQTERSLDSHTLTALVGLAFLTSRTYTSVMGSGLRSYSDDSFSREDLGASIQWSARVTDANSVSAGLSYSDLRHVGSAAQVEDYDSYSANGSWSHTFPDGRTQLSLGVSLIYEVEEGGRTDGDKLGAGLNASVSKQFTDAISGFVSASYQRDNFQSLNELFAADRHDHGYSASGGVTWAFAEGWSLRPQASWRKTVSNVQFPAWSYDQIDVALHLHRLF